MPHRCALGCNIPGVLHTFPNPDKFPERFQTWVKVVGGKLETASDYEFYKKKKICDIHFIHEHRNRFKRLNALAVPTLFLPGPSSTALSEHSDNTTAYEPVNSADLCVEVTGRSISVPAQYSESTITEPEISTARSAAATLGRSISVPAQHTESTIVEPEISTARSSAATLGRSISVPAQHSEGTIAEPEISTARSAAATLAAVISEHNYSVLTRPRRKTSRRDALALYNTAQIRPLQAKIKYLRNEVCRLRKRGQSFKQRLFNAEKLSDNIAFTQITKNMTKPAQLFLNMQRQSRKKPKGRRFSIEEKILSLSLYKKSPKCYRLLYKYFTLPSSKAMKRLLSQIKINPGINPIIFKKIKNTLRDKDEKDRLCSLIFDEMSLTPHISYNAQKDSLEGFACNKETSFADHALVFMVKGVKRNFKQPVAYYFTNNLTKLELKHLIKSVIEHTLQTGLIIVSTVCDQCPVNMGAIAELVNDTKASYLRLDKQWRHDMFRIKGQNIIPLYDIPHLIKGIRNNLINKDLIYEIENEKKIVKWDYYRMVYDADKSYGELRLLDKITEEHINPEKINKMRVKSATQLFSHSVAVVTEHLTARGNLPEECRQLIDITLLLDNLFDLFYFIL